MNRRALGAASASTVLLAAVSVTALAAAQGSSAHPRWTTTGMMRSPVVASTCTVPLRLPGQPVTVMLGDMGGASMMGGGYGGSMMGGRWSGGWMMLRATPQTVRAGAVTLVAVNRGTRTHELVVLPLRNGAQVGARSIGTNNRVHETGSLGEASKTCGAGAGEGIAAGAASWVTLNLHPGRYELVCNLPGHYATGMHTELDAT